MPIEQEELQLRVSLDDQASAQLAALRGQLDQMRSAGGAGGVAAQVQTAAPQIVAAMGQVVTQLTAMGQQLAQLPAQITTAMTGAVQGLQQVQTQLTQVSTNIQQTANAVAGVPAHVARGTQSLTTAMRQAGFIGGIAAGATEEFIGQLKQLGLNLFQRSLDFKGLAESMQDLETRSKGVGMSMTGYLTQQRAMQIGGMTPEQAKDTISRLADLSLELKQYGAENAPTTLRMTRFTDPETTNYIVQTMKQMEGAKLPKQIELINQLREAVDKTLTDEEKAEGFGAAWKELAENMGISAEAFARLDFSKYEQYQRLEKELSTPARDQMLKTRTAETKKFTEQSLIASFYWKDIGDSIAGSLVHGLLLTGATEQLNTLLKRVLDDVETFSRTWAETDFKTALDQLGKMEPAIAPFLEGIRTFIEKDLPDLQAGISKALGAILELQQKAAPKPEDRPAVDKDKELPWGGGLAKGGFAEHMYDFYKNPTLENYMKIFTVPKQEFVPGQRVKGGAEIPERERLDLHPELLDQAKPEVQTQPPPAPPPVPPPEAKPEVQTQPPTVPPEMSERERAARERVKGLRQPSAYQQEEGGGQPILVPASYAQPAAQQVLPSPPPPPEGAGQPIIVPPAMMKALVESGQPEEGGGPARGGLLHPVGFAGKVGENIAQGFTTPKGILRSGADFVEMAKSGLAPEAPTAMDILMSALPFGLGAIPKFIKQHEEVGDPLLQKLRSGLGIPEADVSEPSPWVREGGAWHEGKTGEEVKNFQEAIKSFGEKVAPSFPHRGDWQPGQDESEQQWHAGQNEKQETAETFSNRFGVWPSMGAEKIDQSASKLDQAANTNVNISGAGKIQVDVRAPPGTSVDANGEGFFKSTEITRLTQMLPADMGPLPMTGVGAGQGVAGNGTVS